MEEDLKGVINEPETQYSSSGEEYIENESYLEKANWAEEDTMSILVATDNHLGFLETDGIRGKDSFNSFEEILKIAKENKVDFVLLGGDLFHDNKPSRNTLYQTMSLLRQYCWGDEPCSINFLSDQAVNFPDKFSTVNYLDPNINVSLPVFSIHGNHDDPSGLGGLCALDLLSASGMVNYFGRTSGVDDIQIQPLLLQKGKTKLALYGLGNVRDGRLHQTFSKGKVKAVRPLEEPESWFNLMVLHQNRITHSKAKNDYIPEHFLFDFLDLIIWGHEHDCKITPELNPKNAFYVSQPGSSIATSLSSGESIRKHVALVKVHGTTFDLKAIPLKTVRPFIFEDIQLDQLSHKILENEAKTLDALEREVNKAIDKANAEWEELNPDIPREEWPLPLVRLRVELAPSTEMISTFKCSQRFINKVANPKDVIRFTRKKAPPGAIQRTKEINRMLTQSINEANPTSTSSVDDLFKEILKNQEFNVLPASQMQEALRMFVDKEEKSSIVDIVNQSEKETLNHLKRSLQTEDKNEITERILALTKERENNFDSSKLQFRHSMKGSRLNNEDEDEDLISNNSSNKRTREVRSAKFIRATSSLEANAEEHLYQMESTLKQSKRRGRPPKNVNAIEGTSQLKPNIPNSEKPAQNKIISNLSFNDNDLADRLLVPDTESMIGEHYIPGTPYEKIDLSVDVNDSVSVLNLNERKPRNKNQPSIISFAKPRRGPLSRVADSYIPTEIISSAEEDEQV